MAEAWGVTPAQAAARLRALEWENRDNLRKRLSGERPFPIALPLKPPTGAQALADVARFQDFVRAWRVHPPAGQVRVERRGMRGLNEQEVPVQLDLRSIEELAALLGADEVEALGRWTRRIEQLATSLPGVRAEAIRRFSDLDALPTGRFEELLRLLPHLGPGVGRGGYVRSLPLDGVGTKVLEEHAPLIESLLRAAYSDDGINLFAWLGATQIPSGNVLVRLLDRSLASSFAGLTTLWVASRDVSAIAVPKANIIIVENAQSAFALPEVPRVIAIGATGRDLSWLSAGWLRDRACCYWGDMDSWGYHLLEEARVTIPQLPSLLMDIGTLRDYHRHASYEASSYAGALGARLTQEELDALKLLRSTPQRNRLEQEKIPTSTVSAALHRWLTSIG